MDTINKNKIYKGKKKLKICEILIKKVRKKNKKKNKKNNYVK